MAFYKSLLLLFLLYCSTSAVISDCPNVQMLVTFHPHMDIFWLNSESQLRNINFKPEGFLYAMNQRNSKTIYNSMLQSLTPNSTRKYFTTEVFFFKDWYEYLSADKQQKVKQFLKNGQFELANSGWVENDQAVTYYDDIIGQYSFGMNYMYQKFGYISKVAWATDCFGHSNSQAALINQLGFQMQGIERMDQRYIHDRNDRPLNQLFWKTKSDSNNKTYGGLLTHIRYFLHQVNDLRNVDVPTTVQEFSKVTKAMQGMYQKKILFRFLGNDFEQFIPQQFEHLEKVFTKLNQSIKNCGGYHYGNPTDYLGKIKEHWSKHQLQTRQHDFMPNWDQDRYWSGYYTTDPLSKKKCRDTSRILHFYKKALTHSYAKKDISEFKKYFPALQQSQNVVAMMQHHDGITATSKGWIMKQMRDRMDAANKQIFKDFKQIYNITQIKQCNLIENDNVCQITDVDSDFVLNLYHYGTPKNERIDIVLPASKYFKPSNLDSSNYDVFCGNGNCQVIMSVPLKSGLTQINFVKVNDLTSVSAEESSEGSHKNISWSKSQSAFKYMFNDGTQKYIEVSYHEVDGISTSRQTVAWDKYNTRNQKWDRPTTGIYILVNKGVLNNLYDITNIKVYKGSRFVKIYLTFNNTALASQLTIDLTHPEFFDINTKFRATPNLIKDYYIKLSSNINNPSKQFYHDANGYLVMKRKVDFRPDYKYVMKAEDRINANTYPMTAFAYIKDDTNKLVVFNDRPQGVAIYQPNEIIINIDRLTMEDGKGVGQQYRTVLNHNLKHRVGLVAANNAIQRVWQKQYDQGVMASYGLLTPSSQQLSELTLNNQNKYLKYSTFFSNDHTIVLRVQNLAEFQSMTIKLFNNNKLNSEVLNLNLDSQDWKQSFLNGFPLTQIHKWIQIPSSDINIHENKISNGQVTLQPLQIRSFRIDLTSPINTNTFYHYNINNEINNINEIQQLVPEPSKLQKTPRLTRCF